ncbi:fimbrial protein [Salmonella enterica]|nr:fimbrial protein [Salmonella enterica subsp. enterica serovar Hvittingfoss]EDH3338137.1 fimbrial protein [Salmonella enterica]EDY1894227.1 fimbrial protein [Salmonella enterica]EGU6906124.1 fimbrial protein [Salmonella enterica]
MKKTLIALAVAASAAVSGSAMAWTANGTGGNVELGGTLTPQEKVTPWEVQVGAATTNLDGQIQKGTTSVKISSANAIPLLGIRTVNTAAFVGAPGLAPNISYGNAVNVDKFSDSVAPLTLEVKDAKDVKIGTLKTNVFAQARTSIKGGDFNGKFWTYSDGPGRGFWGGVPKSAGGVALVDHTDYMPGVASHYDAQGVSDTGTPDFSTFSNPNSTYSAYYLSVIAPQQAINISLDAPAAADAIVWKASLPVTVSYQ